MGHPSTKKVCNNPVDPWKFNYNRSYVFEANVKGIIEDLEKDEVNFLLRMGPEMQDLPIWGV